MVSFAYARLVRPALTALLCLASLSATAAPVIWDWSPQATGGSVTNDFWSNTRPGQHFGERVSFASDTIIGGMDIYLATSYGSVGSNVVVSIWQDANGIPGAVGAQYFTTATEVDLLGASAGNHRLHADFQDYLMEAGINYWIGMAGDNITLTQTGLAGIAGGDSKMAQFNSGDGFSYFTGESVGDMAFRLYGSGNDVPEPGTLALLGLGLAGLAAKRRYKK